MKSFPRIKPRAILAWIIPIALSLFMASCPDPAPEALKPLTPLPSPEAEAEAPSLQLNFSMGSQTTYKNIYVIWAQDGSGAYLQNFRVCKRLLDGSLTGVALPYWKTNVYPQSNQAEIDAVSAATVANADFSLVLELGEDAPLIFSVYMEIDRSFDPNDWFTDQPAILYAADIDLSSGASSYQLTPRGWTANQATASQGPGTASGNLNPEMRYISHHESSGGFGVEDPQRATAMVASIILKLE